MHIGRVDRILAALRLDRRTAIFRIAPNEYVLLRDLARSGRLARLRIRLQDRPGALFNVARIFHEQGVNIIEVYHQRVFTTLPAKGLITDIECETRDRNHLDRLLTALRRAQYEVSQVELQ